MIGEDIIEGLCTFIKGDWIDDNVDGAVITRKWFGAAEDSINALFSFASEPDFHAGARATISVALGNIVPRHDEGTTAAFVGHQLNE